MKTKKNRIDWAELRTLRRRADRSKTLYLASRDEIARERACLESYEDEIRTIELSQNTLQIVSQELQEGIHEHLAAVVNICLVDVFPDEDYGFRIKFTKIKNRTQARPILLNEGHEIQDPLDEDSGGAVDVAAFVLQFASLLLAKPPIPLVMALDEPFKFVSVEYRKNVCGMIEMLQREFGVQFIIVTHMKELMMGKIVNL